MYSATCPSYLFVLLIHSHLSNHLQKQKQAHHNLVANNRSKPQPLVSSTGKHSRGYHLPPKQVHHSKNLLNKLEKVLMYSIEAASGQIA